MYLCDWPFEFLKYNDKVSPLHFLCLFLFIFLETSYTLKKLKRLVKKSRIREKKHLSTDADNSTDAIGGWSKNTQKPDNPLGSVVSTMFCKEKSAKKTFFCAAILDHFQTKMFKC